MSMFWGDPSAVVNAMVQGRQCENLTQTPRVIQHTRHGGGPGNYVFADGDAASHPFPELWEQESGLQPALNWFDSLR